MTKTEIKQNIHSLVETMDNENILIQVKEMLESISNESTSFSSLSKDEQKSIQNGIEQLNNGEKINYERCKEELSGMVKKVIFSPEANERLKEIINYLVKEWSVSSAEKFHQYP